jgi:hypothetical protein
MYLFGHNNNFGTLDSFLDIEWRESGEFVWEVEVAASSASDYIEADYKSCV